MTGMRESGTGKNPGDIFSEIGMCMTVKIGKGKCHYRNPKRAKTASDPPSQPGPKMKILEVQIDDLESREERFLNIPKVF